MSSFSIEHLSHVRKEIHRIDQCIEDQSNRFHACIIFINGLELDLYASIAYDQKINSFCSFLQQKKIIYTSMKNLIYLRDDK